MNASEKKLFKRDGVWGYKCGLVKWREETVGNTNKKKHKDEILPFVSSPGCNCLDEKQETRSFFVFFNLQVCKAKPKYGCVVFL